MLITCDMTNRRPQRRIAASIWSLGVINVQKEVSACVTACVVTCIKMAEEGFANSPSPCPHRFQGQKWLLYDPHNDTLLYFAAMVISVRRIAGEDTKGVEGRRDSLTLVEPTTEHISDRWFWGVGTWWSGYDAAVFLARRATLVET